MNFQYVERTRDLLTFENPSKPLNVFNMRRALGNKNLAGYNLQNVRTEVYETDVIDPRSEDCTDCSVVNEPISVRLIVSGSVPAADRLKQMVRNVCAAYIRNESTFTRGSLPSQDVVISDNVVITIS